MAGFVEYLHETLTFFRSPLFYTIFTIAIVGQPIAVWLQAIKAWRADSVEGISLPTFITMLCLQTLAMGYGIREIEPAIFYPMFVSFFGSIAIILAIVVRCEKTPGPAR